LSSTWLAFLEAVPANSVGNLLIKAFAQKTTDGSIADLSPRFILGAAFFGFNLIIYGKALRGLVLNVACPIVYSVIAISIQAA
jgi:hypothetical protein